MEKEIQAEGKEGNGMEEIDKMTFTKPVPELTRSKKKFFSFALLQFYSLYKPLKLSVTNSSVFLLSILLYSHISFSSFQFLSFSSTLHWL